MKKITLFKAWMKFINIAWTGAILVAALYTIAYFAQSNYNAAVVIVVSMFFVAAMAFKTVIMGVSHTLIIMSQDLNILVKDAKIREVERNRTNRK